MQREGKIMKQEQKERQGKLERKERGGREEE